MLEIYIIINIKAGMIRWGTGRLPGGQRPVRATMVAAIPVVFNYTINCKE